MSDTQSITTIKQEEVTAEETIAKAKEVAEQAKAQLDTKYEAELANAAQGLTKEMTEIKEKVQTEAVSFKSNITTETKKQLAEIKSGSDARIKKAKELVNQSFAEYVSK